MESINQIASKIIDQVNEDLENIQRLAPETVEYVDNIKINVASGLTTLRFMLQDKVRLREVTISEERKFTVVNDEVVVMVLGIVKRASTVQASGHYSVAWGVKHPLNIAKQNHLATKTRNNSALLGLLAALTQVEVCGFKRIKVMTTNQAVLKTIAQLDLYHADNYMDGDRQPLPDHDVLKMIYEKKKTNDIQISVFTFQPPTPLSGLYRALLETARDNIEAIT